MQVAGESFGSVASRLLGRIHGVVGVADQVDGAAAGRARGDADRGGHPYDRGVGLDRCDDAGEKLIDEPLQLGVVVDLGDDDELIATEPSEGATWPGPDPEIRRAAVIRIVSPRSWPRLSLIILNRSRSMNSTATRARCRAARSSASLSRSTSKARLASPVSGSWSA